MLVAQSRYGELVPRITGSISSAASAIILYLIFRSSTRLKSIYHRIMFGMSVADFFTSLAMTMTHLPMPREGLNTMVDSMNYEGLRVGNSRTCSAQGFFYFFGAQATYLYNGALSVYYYCVIVRTMREDAVKKKVEIPLHLLATFWPLVVCIWLLFQDRYHVAGFAWCTPSNPPSCIDEDCSGYLLELPGKEVTLIASINILLCLIVMFLCLGSVYFKIYSLNKHLTTTGERSNPTAFSQSEVVRRSRNFENIDSDPLRMLRQTHWVANKVVAIQALVYVLAVLVTLFFPFSRMVGRLHNETLEILQLIFQPLQGLFNCLIFVSFKVFNIRAMNPGTSIASAIYQLFFKSTADPIFISRIAVVIDEGNVVRGFQVADEFISIEGDSLDHMDNREDESSDSSALKLDFQMPVFSPPVSFSTDLSLISFNEDGLRSNGDGLSYDFKMPSEERYSKYSSGASTIKR